MTEKLPRVKWEMGQTLLPEHFYAQEAALTADMILRSEIHGLPDYGVAALGLNESLLADGVLSIRFLTLITPSGTLIHVPKNARVSPLNLNMIGMIRVPVYLHILNPLQGESSAAGGFSQEVEGEIPHLIYPLALSSEQTHSGAIEAIKLAEFVKTPDGIWALAESYLPPLLQLGTSPFLKTEFETLLTSLEAFHYDLSLDAASYLTGESLFSVRNCLKWVFQVQRYLKNTQSQVHLHPYFAYDLLKQFYIEVCFYRKTAPQDTTSSYQHENLAQCFGAILKPLMAQLQAAKTRPPYLPFEYREGMHRIDLPVEIQTAKEVYFLIQKSRVNVQVSVQNLKLASASRLPLVHKLALQGVALTKTDSPPFQHAFGAEVDFFFIHLGEEWDYALNEKSLTFYHSPQFQDLNFYLYWR